MNLSFGFEENGINRNITNLKQNFANLNSNIKKTDATFKSAERSASEYKAEQVKLTQASKLLAKNLDDLESEMNQLDLSTAKGKKKHSQLIKEFNKEAIAAQMLENRIDELGDEYTELAFKATVAGKAMRGMRGINTVMDGVHAQVGQIAERFRNLGEIGTMVIRGMLMTNLSALVPLAGSVVSAIAGIGGALVAITGGAIGMAGAFGIAGAGVFTFAGMAKTALEMVKNGTMQSSSALTTYKTSLTGLQNQWKGLVQANAGSIFTTMSNGINIARIALTKLTPFINKTSTIIASMSGRMRDWVNSSKNASQFFKILNNIGPPIMQTLLNAVMSFVNGTTALFNKLSPLFLWAAQGFANMAKSFDNWANSVQGSQAIANFVNYTKTNLPVVGAIFGNLFSGIISLFQAFAPHSEAVLQGMKGVTQSFKDWATQLANTQGFKDFIAYLNENGPKVWNILKNIGSIIVSVVQGMAPFGQWLINIIGPFTSWIAKMLSAHGWLRKIVGAMSMVVGAIMLAVPIFGTLKGIFMAVTTAAMRKALAMKIATGATKAWTLATKLGTVAMKAFRWAVTLMTGPIGIVILAITALVAGIIYLWKTNKTFRTIVINTWNAIKNGAISIFGAIKNFIVAAWNFIKYWSVRIWAGIKASVVTIIRLLSAGIRIYIYAIRKIITTVFSFIRSWSLKIWNGLKNAVVKVVRLLQVGIRLYIYAIRKVITTVFNFIRTWAVKIWNGIKNGIIRIVRILSSTVRNVFNFLKNGIVKTISVLRSWIIKAWTIIKNRTVSIVRSLWKGITGIWNAIASTTRRIFNYIKKWLAWVWNTIKAKVISVVRALWNGVRNIFNALSKGTRNIFNSVRKFLTGLWTSIKNRTVSTVKVLWNGVRNVWSNLSKGTRNIFNGVKNSLINTWNTIKSKVTGIASSLWGSVKKTFTNMKNGIKGLAGKIGDTIKGMVNGIKKGLNKLIEAVNFVGGKLGIDKKIPKLSTGTGGASHTGGVGMAPGAGVSGGKISSAGFAVVNDKGNGNGSGPNGHQEVIQRANGSMIAPKGKNVTVPLGKGDVVHSGKAVQRAQANGILPKFSSGTGKDMLKKRKKKNHEHAFDAIGAFGPSGGGLKDGLANLLGTGIAKTKKKAKKAGDVAQGAKAALGAAGNWAKNKAGDLLEFVGSPHKLLDKVMKEFGVKFPDIKGQIPQNLWGGMWKGLKNGVRTLFDGWLTEAEGAGDGGYIDLSKGINFGYAPSAAKAAAMGYPFPRAHHGIDVGYKYGEKLYSTMSGTATGKPGYNGGFGNSMWIKNGPLQAIYGHMSKLNWTGNKKVKPGSYLGKVGSTGDSTGPQNIGVIIRQRILNNSLNSQDVRCAS